MRCSTCRYRDLAADSEPCDTCHSRSEWEPRACTLEPTQEQRITELERRLDELTETLRNV